MSPHPLIGFRPGTTTAIVLGTNLEVAELVGVVSASSGSVSEAATLLGLDERLVQAAVDYREDQPVSSSGSADGSSVLRTLSQALSLVAGITAVVYLAGAIVLALRLAFVGLPWNAVIGQLPRELALSIGVGQILLPTVALISMYGAWRLGKGGRDNMPTSRRWRDAKRWRTGKRRRAAKPSAGRRRDDERWGKAFRRVLLGLALTLPGAVFIVAAQLRHGELKPTLLWLLFAWVLLSGVAFLVVELRAVAIAWLGDRWHSVTGFAVIAAVYSLAFVPSLVLCWAALPLESAKLCTTSGSDEVGDLVGEGRDMVFLGEATPDYRRIAAFPAAQVEELFVGPFASRAQCDPRGPAAALRAAQKADEAVAAARQVRRLTDPLAKRAADVATLASLLHETGAATKETADLALRLQPAFAERAFDAGTRATEMAFHLDHKSGDAEPPWTVGAPPSSVASRALAERAAAAAMDAAFAARAAAVRLLIKGKRAASEQ